MLKSKLKGLEKRLDKLNKNKINGVFFVGIEEGQYIIKGGPGLKTYLQGDKEEYEKFMKKHDEGSVFIIDDIPREQNGTNIFDWVN
jgi:hypothetical protein